MKRFLLLALLVTTTSITYSQEVYNPDRHNTSLDNAWLSCYTLESPNPTRGESHWVMYDLKGSFELHEVQIWNLNDGGDVSQGMQDIAIDVSIDGENWTEAAAITLAPAPASGYFTGAPVADLSGVPGRYILITGVTNHGGECYGLSEVKINLQSASLPISLVDFKAECGPSAGDVELSWTTSSEVNNDYYQVQTSTDNETWTDVAEVTGLNLIEENNYSYSISGSNALSYYRLVQVDYDGTETVLPVELADCTSEDELFVIAPNPVVNSTRISYLPMSGNDIQVSVVNAQGKLVTSKTISNQNQDMLNFDLDMENWIPGTYMLKIKEGPYSEQKSLVKM